MAAILAVFGAAGHTVGGFGVRREICNIVIGGKINLMLHNLLALFVFEERSTVLGANLL